MPLPRPIPAPRRESRPDTRRPQVQDTAAELFHSVMSQDWSREDAGHDLLARADGDRHLLLVLRARIARRLINQRSPIAERAVATLNAALDDAERHRCEQATPS